MRNLLRSVLPSIIGLMLVGVPARTHPVSPHAQSGQQSEPATQAISGTVSLIGNHGQSFTLEVNNGDTQQIVQFVIDENTQVQGQVTLGTAVSVRYQARGGQNVALTVTAQA